MLAINLTTLLMLLMAVATSAAAQHHAAVHSAAHRRLTQQLAAGAPRVCDATGATQLTSLDGCAYVVADPAAAAELLFGPGVANATTSGSASNLLFSAARASSGSKQRPTPPPLPRVRVIADVANDPRIAKFAAADAAAAAAARGNTTRQPPPPPQPLFHEAGVWLAGRRGPHTVLFTSDRLGNTTGVDQFVHISLVDPTGRAPPAPLLLRNVTSLRNTPLPMANGGALVPGTRGNVVLVCYQGIGGRGGGLAALNVATGEVKLVLTRAGASGANFSSPNDVVIIPVPRGGGGGGGGGGRGGGSSSGGTGGVRAFAPDDGARYAVVLLTDPAYGYDQGFRLGHPDHGGGIWAVTVKLPPPAAAPGGTAAPARWWPEAVGPARVVADGYGRPNGLAVSPDRKTLYASDTAFYSGGGYVDPATGLIDGAGAGTPVRAKPARARTIYAHDLAFAGGGPGGGGVPTVTLGPRRVFAAADAPIPDGLRADADGRLFSGEGDGVSVYEPGTGRLLVRVRTGTAGGARSAGVANFALVPAGGDGGGGGGSNGTAAGAGSGGGGGGGYVVMGQQTQVTAVRLPGLRVFNTESWL